MSRTSRNWLAGPARTQGRHRAPTAAERRAAAALLANPAEAPHTPAAEAGLLLRRLDVLAGSLESGFDAPTSAELVIDAIDRQVRATRRGVLVGYVGTVPVPFALRGAHRVPWLDLHDETSVVGGVWATHQPAFGTETTEDGRRSVLAVPLFDAGGERIGMLVLDRELERPFSAGDLSAAIDVAAATAPSLDVALIFAALRERAAFEERERLAREMHDGIAQEMAALGYAVDALRREAAAQGSPLAGSLDELRTHLGGVLGDIKLRIGDLRTAVRPDRGLGAVVGDRLQRFGTTTGLSVVLRLAESGLRLPAHAETLIYRLVLDVLTDARHARGTTSVDLTLEVSAPQAFLRIVHDGQSALSAANYLDHPLTSLGAQLLVETKPRGGVVVQMHLRPRQSMPAATLLSRLPADG